MAKFLRLDVYKEIIDTGLIPVFYNPSFDTSVSIIEALADCGVRTIEFTNRGDNAHKIFSKLVEHFQAARPELILGVGSIIDPVTAGIYMASGANFVVGPLFNLEVAKLCNRLKIAYSPGCSSATEISDAEESGVEIVKIFPGGSVGGPGFVKSILGPMPWVRMMPTGGVEATRESIKEWFSAGVCSVGIGSDLIKKTWVQNREFGKISDLCNQVIHWIREARGLPLFTGLDHIGLYPAEARNDQELLLWYEDLFALDRLEKENAFFLGGSQMGKLEISKVEVGLKPHIAIRTSDFDKAVSLLKQKGVEIDEPIIKKDMKLAFLRSEDPAGNKVHIVWRKEK